MYLSWGLDIYHLYIDYYFSYKMLFKNILMNCMLFILGMNILLLLLYVDIDICILNI